ncbi:MMPL family transporter [Luteimonas sp. e5]
MTPPRRSARIALALAWLGLLVLGALWLSTRLVVSGDLRKFMPAPQTDEQRLLIDELGEGPGSRLLLIALEGAPPAELARQSQALADALAAQPDFALVSNGRPQELDAIPERLRPWRYLLTSSFDHAPLDREYLAAELAARVSDLGSPAASLLEPLIGADPTLETLKLVEAWQPPGGPQLLHEVWFDRADKAALLVAETRAAGFDPQGQARAVAGIHAAFANVRGDSGSRMSLGGPGAISVEISQRTAGEASRLGLIAGIGVLLVLLLAYRSWRHPLVGALPLASAGVVGLATVSLLFADIHGITIAFGFTLLGVAQDYPVHLFSQQRPGLAPRLAARAIWPTLATGVVSTCIGYLAFLASGVDGLKQLAAFTVSGLLTAALTTRFLLPLLLTEPRHDLATQPMLGRLQGAVTRLPRLPGVALAVLALAAIAVAMLAPGPFWENDLSRLTPAPADLISRDVRLRDELGAPDVRYLLALDGADVEAVLEAGEALQPKLEELREAGVIGGWDMAARYLPSAALQRARQARLPAPAQLRTELDAALADSPFRADAFDDFLADVETARTARPLTLADLRDTALGPLLDGLLREGDGRATALVSLSAISDDARFLEAAHAAGLHPLDLKTTSESLVAQYRERVLWSLLVAAVLLAGMVALMLRDARRSVAVLLPMLLTTLLVVALLRAFGVELNLFHLVALILAAGLGLDYALFFNHAGDDGRQQRRTLHALLVCAVTTLLVFALLALSAIPVLRAIGLTVSLGVVCNFMLGLLLTRRPASTMEPGSA